MSAPPGDQYLRLNTRWFPSPLPLFDTFHRTTARRRTEALQRTSARPQVSRVTAWPVTAIPARKFGSGDPRGGPNGFWLWWFPAPHPFPVAPVLDFPFLPARPGSAVALLRLPTRPSPRRFPAGTAAKTLQRLPRTKALRASFQQALPHPWPAPSPSSDVLLFGWSCRILGKAHGR
jgi:hypothetical protein